MRASSERPEISEVEVLPDGGAALLQSRNREKLRAFRAQKPAETEANISMSEIALQATVDGDSEPPYKIHTKGIKDCPSGYTPIVDPDACGAASEFFNKTYRRDKNSESWQNGNCIWCQGCQGKFTVVRHYSGENSSYICQKEDDGTFGFYWMAKGFCKGVKIGQGNSEQKKHIGQCAQRCANLWNCDFFSFAKNKGCLLFKNGHDCSQRGNQREWVTYKKNSRTPYVPGRPGARWELGEMLLVKAKLFKAFVPTGSMYTWNQIPAKNKQGLKYSSTSAMKILRLAFHDCMKNKDGSGGCDGCLDWEGVGERFDPSLRFHYNNTVFERGHNTALAHAVAMLEEMYTNRHYPRATHALPRSLKDSGKSRADLIAFAGQVAVEYGIQLNNLFCRVTPWQAKSKLLGRFCQHLRGQPNCRTELQRPIRFKYGRKDCVTSEDKPYKTPSGKREAAPPPMMSGDQTFAWFKTNFGMNKRQTVAIMGAHSFAGMHVSHSLFRYGWTSVNAGLFNNKYYRLLTLKKDPRIEHPDNCNAVTDAFGETHKGRWIAVVWTQMKNGGPVQWLKEDYVCQVNCHLKTNVAKDCCLNKPSGQFCRSDRVGRHDKNFTTDPTLMGCEGWTVIHGADEAMMNPDMGMYYNFSVDRDGAPRGCGNDLKGFHSDNWKKGLNVFSTKNGIWHTRKPWQETHKAKFQPRCPLNTAKDDGDVPVHEIVEQYADDGNAFADDFVKAYEKMVSNGYGEGQLKDGPDYKGGWCDAEAAKKAFPVCHN